MEVTSNEDMYVIDWVKNLWRKTGNKTHELLARILRSQIDLSETSAYTTQADILMARVAPLIVDFCFQFYCSIQDTEGNDQYPFFCVKVIVQHTMCILQRSKCIGLVWNFRKPGTWPFSENEACIISLYVSQGQVQIISRRTYGSLLFQSTAIWYTSWLL